VTETLKEKRAALPPDVRKGFVFPITLLFWSGYARSNRHSAWGATDLPHISGRAARQSFRL